MIGLLAAAWAAPFAWGVLYVWNGGASDDNWTSCNNWTTASPEDCYPDDGITDDATFPSAGSPWDVALSLTSADVDEMDIDGSVDFTTVTDPASVTVDKLTISAGGTEIVVTSTWDAEILIGVFP